MAAHPDRHGPARRFTNFALCVVALFAFLSSAYAEEPGLSWLRLQQGADGGFAPTEASVQQTTFEVARAFRALGYSTDSQYSSALQYVLGDTNSGIPYLTQRLIAAKLAGSSVDALKGELLQYQNADGGFGTFVGAQSSVIDTVDALEALSEAGVSERATVQPALTFLMQGQGADGGFSFGINLPSVYLTARVAVLFERFQLSYNLSAPLQGALNYLWSTQGASGWGSDWETAVVLQALIPATTDATRYSPVVDYLRGRELADGSWSASAYATALALQALYLADHRPAPQDPTTGFVTGALVDGSNGLPVSGVQVLLSGTSQETRSASDGRFELSGVAPGAYTLEYRHDAYSPVQQQIQVQAGQRLDVGSISLQMLPTTGLLQGIVVARATGLPIAGAAVSVTGTGGTWMSASGADGSFQLVLPPGVVNITVSASGFETAAATGTVVAGGVLRFSPSLRVDDPGLPSETTVTIKGRAVDGSDGAPVAAAQVVVASGGTAVTAADGTFEVTGPTATELTIEIQASGYLSIRVSGIASQGGVLELGDLRLPRDTIATESSISGVVTDVEDGKAIAGAAVAVGGSSANTDENGHFSITGIQTLSFDVSVSATGYFGRRYAVTLAKHGPVDLPVQLRRTAFGGIDVTAVASSEPAYEAYSQVRLTATLANSATIAAPVRVGVKVLDPTGTQIDEFAALTSQAGGGDVFSIPPATNTDVAVDWYNRHYAPGVYRLWLQVFDAATSEVLAERVVAVTVLETRRLEYVSLAAEPGYANQNATSTIRFVMSMRNRSNVPVTFAAQYRLTSPGGDTIHVGDLSADIEPAVLSTTLAEAPFDYVFPAAGRYPYDFVTLQGADVVAPTAGAIDVAPNIRIEPSQGLEPGVVVPQGDARLRMKIRIEGVNVP